jgi:16S rRNA (guanine527-N7)-methyltransferase
VEHDPESPGGGRSGPPRPSRAAAGPALPWDPRSILDLGLHELGLDASEPQRHALFELARLVERWSARINLTGHRGLDAIVRRLVLDSAALVAQLPEIESLADIGAGAGFPGLPAAILRPRCRVTLVEARERRHHFQLAACRVLGLANAHPVRGRAEGIPPTPHAAVVAQALARPAAALALMVAWAAPGGMVILPCGADPPEISHPRVDPERTVRYRVPCGGPARSLWIGRVARGGNRSDQGG